MSRLTIRRHICICLIIMIGSYIIYNAAYFEFVTPPILQKTISGEWEDVRRLLNEGHDPNATSAIDRHRTPIMFAAAAGQVDVVRLLIAKGADVNASDSHGCTVLTWTQHSTSKRYPVVRKILLENGAHE